MVEDNERIEEFIACNMVLGNNTIYKNVIGIKPGETITIIQDSLLHERYFNFIPHKNSIDFKDINEFTMSYDKVIQSVFRRILIQNSKVNNWIIPLSGGHDSRLTVNYLYKLGVKMLYAFPMVIPRMNSL